LLAIGLKLFESKSIVYTGNNKGEYLMTKASESRLDRILRRARQNVFTDDTQGQVILRAKALLMPTWDKRHCEVASQSMEKVLAVYFL
jgi:hypothetical protein